MEKSVIICRVCNQNKDRYLAKKYADGNKKWVDANGKSFNGKVCSTCHLDYMKNKMRTLRAAPESDDSAS